VRSVDGHWSCRFACRFKVDRTFLPARPAGGIPHGMQPAFADGVEMEVTSLAICTERPSGWHD
jgi:hypothetical protein